MIDWTNIITTTIAVLIGSGGLATIVTLREKKNAAFLENNSKLIDQWQEVATERHERAKELKGDLDTKDKKIDQLYAEISKMRNELDHLRTINALANVLKCNKISCTDREPPYGTGIMNEKE